MAERAVALDALQRRNLTDSFLDLLWKEFVKAHKERRVVPARPSREMCAAEARVGLVGEGAAPRYAQPYPHQERAWVALDELRAAAGRRSGLMVIPTGGGKTATMVRWLIGEMQARPQLRVLWIADQQELVDQAAREFAHEAKAAPRRFERLLRRVHGEAGPASALADPATDVVCATRQSLVGNARGGLSQNKRNYLSEFVQRPTVVVVDEAHHAVSDTYQTLLEHLWATTPDMMLVGLTATPWPSGAGRTKLLRETFMTDLVSVTTAQLVATGDLARPVLHTVETSSRIEVTDDDVAAIGSARDLPVKVRSQLNRTARNDLVVRQWLDREDEWGKTLVFAVDTQHADALGEAFVAAGVDAVVLHSGLEVDRSAVLQRFRHASGPRVVVSVAMLLEGVDIPSARTAFLCRPTGSCIVMRQMIGRVLRGVRAGGDAEAHVVDFVDQWSQQVEVLSPVDIPDVEMQQTWTPGGEGERRLPPIVADNGIEIGEDLLRSIERSMADRARADGLTATLTSARLIGFYDLDTARIPVFEHAVQAWHDAAEWALGGSGGRGSTARTFFDDVPTPEPLDNDITAFVAYCRSTGAQPPFVEAVLAADLASLVRRLREENPTGRPSFSSLRAEYERSLIRSLYPTFQFFLEAVHQEELVQEKMIDVGISPESLPALTTGALDGLRHQVRDLQDLYLRTIEQGEEILATEPLYAGLLDRAVRPGIEWTRRPIEFAWAYYSWRRATRAKGKPIIRVNRALEASPSQVPDEVLMLLIWHELCHHLALGGGHDAEFRRLEALWPDQARLDHELDTLHERYDTGMTRHTA